MGHDRVFVDLHNTSDAPFFRVSICARPITKREHAERSGVPTRNYAAPDMRELLIFMRNVNGTAVTDRGIDVVPLSAVQLETIGRQGCNGLKVG